MFGMLKSLTKAAVGVAVAPIAIVADIVTLPASSEDLHSGPFDKTSSVLKSVGDNLKNAVDPDSE